MDLNDMRDALRRVKAPQTQPGVPRPAGGVEDLIGRLEAHDAEEHARLKRSRLLFAAAVGLMGLAFVGTWLAPDGSLHLHRALHQGALFAAFVYITIGLSGKMWHLSRIDYTQSARSFLDEAEQRYIFMRRRDYVVMFCGLLLLGVASAPYVLGVFVSRYTNRGHYPVAVVLYCLFYLLVCAVGLYFTRRNWKRDKAPLLEDLRRMKDTLATEESDSA